MESGDAPQVARLLRDPLLGAVPGVGGRRMYDGATMDFGAMLVAVVGRPC